MSGGRIVVVIVLVSLPDYLRKIHRGSGNETTIVPVLLSSS